MYMYFMQRYSNKVTFIQKYHEGKYESMSTEGTV